MSEFYESENNCVRCLRSSPIASLIGFIVVLIGGGAFAGATIFARRYLIALLDAPNLFPCLDYAVYGLVGAIGLFSLLAYILCALSSGWNAKHCFESSRKSACGRCCNMTLIVLLVLAVVIWVAIACLMTYPLMSIAFLWHRNEGATRLRLSSLELPLLTRQTRSAPSYLPDASGPSLVSLAATNPVRSLTKRPQRQTSDMVDFEPPPHTRMDSIHGFYDEDTASSAVNTWSGIPNKVNDFTDMGKQQQHPVPDNVDSVHLSDARETLNKLNEASQPTRRSEVMSNLSDTAQSTLSDLTSRASSNLQEYGQSSINKALSASEALAMFFKCSPDSIDLSYYGLYDAQGLPIYVARNNLRARTQNILICVCIAVAGIFLLILGYLQIVICTAMNYARMQEARYYEASSEVGEEGVALQQ